MIKIVEPEACVNIEGAETSFVGYRKFCSRQIGTEYEKDQDKCAFHEILSIKKAVWQKAKIKNRVSSCVAIPRSASCLILPPKAILSILLIFFIPFLSCYAWEGER